MDGSNEIIGAKGRQQAVRARILRLCGLRDGEVLTPEIVARHLHTVVLPENPRGFSFDCFRWTCDPCVPPDSFGVSLRELGQRWDDVPTFSDVLAWVSLNLSRVFEVNGLIGGWPADGSYWLDVTIAVQGWEQANLLAWNHNQIAIYDFDAGDSIRVVEPRIRVAL